MRGDHLFQARVVFNGGHTPALIGEAGSSPIAATGPSHAAPGRLGSAELREAEMFEDNQACGGARGRRRIAAALAWVIATGIVAAAPARAKDRDPADATAAARTKDQEKDEAARRKWANSVRGQLDVEDDNEWAVLAPRVARVQVLARQLRDLREPKKALEPPRLPKALRTSDGTQPYVPPYLIELAARVEDLRAARADPATSGRDIENRLAAFRTARATAERQLAAELAAARESLREVLTARQELAAVANGLLD
jgi:hypothetical protein